MKKLISPKSLCIEANASCQLRCPTCPTTSKGYPPVVGSGYLKFRDFKKLLDDNPQILRIDLENRGEMFLNPELLTIIEYAHKKKVTLHCNGGVNLNNVQDEVLEGLVKYRFRSLLCSIDGATAETYRIYRIGGDFNRVIANIQRINHYKKIYHSCFPKLTWLFVVFGHNEHEIPMARKMANDLNMDFAMKMSWDSNYSPIRDKKYVMAETGWPATTREEYANITGINYMRGVCYALWKNPRVNWDGKILGCCWNSWGEFGGNAFEGGYVPSINNEKINYARQMLLGEAKFRADLPCSTCQLYLEMRNSNNYLTINEIMYHSKLWYRGVRFIYRILNLKRLTRRMQK